MLGIAWVGFSWHLGSGRAEPLLKVDFGVSGAASPVQPGFTGIAGMVSETSHFEFVGPYTVSLDGQGFFATGGNSNNIDPSVRSLYRDYYYNNSPLNGEGVILSLGGFDPNTQYDVTLWSYDADQIFSETDIEWTPFGDTTGPSAVITNFATPYPTSLLANRATIQVTSTTGTLEFFGTTTSGGGGTRLNAFTVRNGSTDLLAVDFGRASQPSSPVQATYTGVMGEIAQPLFSQPAGPFNITLEGQGFFNTTSSNADLIDAGARDFYRDYYYNNSITNGEGVELTIEGVTPNIDYDLTLWTYDADNFNPTPTTWTPTGNTTGQTGNIVNIQDPYPTSLTENSATIRVRSTTTSLQVFGTTTEGTGGTRLNGFELNLAPEGIDGDYNDDGKVDAADYVVWRKNESTMNTLPNDPHGGTIGALQYDTWRANFGAMAGSGGGLHDAAIPEPSTFVALLIGVILILNRPFGCMVRALR
ncbi:MAG: hypothetical protein WD738_12320 [Pirellulales bacterium]